MARKLKDSYASWIGKIPESWDIIKLKYLFLIIGGNGFPDNLQGNANGDYPFCKVSDINSHADYVNTASNWVSQSVVDGNGFNIIPAGSIIMAKIGAALAKNHRKINSVQCCIDNNTQALVPRRDDNIRYLFYLSKCIDMSWFDNNSTVPSINNSKLLSFFVPNVPKKEQERIASLLDAKCAELDDVIAQTRASIEEYKKLKQAVITQAVTKGIRPNRQMKDSRVEWIGEIPVDWHTPKVKYFATIRSGITLGKVYSSETKLVEYPYLRVANVKDSYVDLNDVAMIKVTEEEADKYRLQNGELLMTEGGDRDKLGRGTVWHAQIDPCLHQNHIFALKTSLELIPEYVSYISTSFVGRNYFDVTANQSVHLASTNSTTIMNFIIPYPSISEQHEIVDYLDKATRTIDKTISDKERLLTEIESYKKSLIYEYVTGKKEVPA